MTNSCALSLFINVTLSRILFELLLTHFNSITTKGATSTYKNAFTISIGDGVKKVWIPNSVKDVFTNEVQIPEDNDIATTENVAHVAMLLFAGYIDAATSMSESCGGGGSQDKSQHQTFQNVAEWHHAGSCTPV